MSTTVRFYFDGLSAATQALLTVLLDARKTSADYSFGSLSGKSILTSGLRLEGDIDDISAQLEKIPGSVKHAE